MAEVVKDLAVKAGLDPDLVAAHSLRSGWITEAAQQGMTVLEVQTVSHHISTESVADYFTPVDQQKNNISRQLCERAGPSHAEPAPPPLLTFAQRVRRRS